MTRGKSLLGLAGWLAASFVAAWTGMRFLPGPWYAALEKPEWTPPNAVFPPVWTALYLMMAVAAWLVWRRGGFAAARAALVLYLVQLGLNAAWSYLSFGLHRLDIAFYDIVALWLAIVLVTVMFWRRSRAAGALMVPYLLWVGFAAGLNLMIWRLNTAASTG